MFLKPDYNLKSIYDINLEELKEKGINSLLFDLDSTLMASKSGEYSEKTLLWLEKVKQNFFVGIVSNNNNPKYIEKVMQVTNIPIVFSAAKPNTKIAEKFMSDNCILPQYTAFIGDRPLTDTLCGKRLGCTTILVDSITADTEKPIVRFVRKLERLTIKK